ncbi:MAG: Ig-like domain-containing protein [Thermoplasmata archaeon]|nr:Ig-like domain-containing protein [Thermoplasmata archaeon]
MAKKSQKRKKETKTLLDKGYVPCFYCDELVKENTLKCSHCGRWYSSGKQVIAVAVAIIIVLSTVGIYYNLPGESQNVYVLSATPTGTTVSISSYISASFNKEMNKTSVESALSITPSVSGTFSWNGNTIRYTPSGSLTAGTHYTVTIGNDAVDIDGRHLDCDVYTWRFTTDGGTITTRRDIGIGDNDFWSTTVNHPSWVMINVQSKPVLILTHTEGCLPCIAMTESCNELSETYTSQITFYDLISGTHEPQASECFSAYDPVPPNYVPLTTIVTKGPNNQIIWHSWEGEVEKSVLSSWIEDAILYHKDD